jgi:hypothetical protein
MSQIEVLEPAGQVRRIAPLRLNPVGELRGARIAILDNVKPNFRLLATLAAEQLMRECGAARILHFDKPNAAVGAHPETLDEIARSADLVLTGSAD